MIEDLDDLTEQLENLREDEQEERGEDEGEGLERSWEEERLQLEDEMVKLSAKLEDVRAREWVRKQRWMGDAFVLHNAGETPCFPKKRNDSSKPPGQLGRLGNSFIYLLNNRCS